MAELSPRMDWPFPSENEDPWYQRYEDQIRAQDASGFAAREDRNLILSGGGTISWAIAAGIGTLTWTDSFSVWSPSTGFFSQLVANALALQDGQVIRAEIVRAPGANRNVAAEVANIMQNTDDSLVLGMRQGDNFVFRNGFIIKDGVSGPAEDIFSGGGVTSTGDDFGPFDRVPPDEVQTIPEDGHVVVSGGMISEGGIVLEGSLALLGSGDS